MDVPAQTPPPPPADTALPAVLSATATAATDTITPAEESPHSPAPGAGIPGLFLLDGPAAEEEVAVGAVDPEFTVRDFVFAVETPAAAADADTDMAAVDRAFLAAGEANRTDSAAEWHLDSSDSSCDSSSDSSSSSDSDAADSDDDYPLMDHAQLAKLLMREDGDSDGSGAHKEGLQGPLKTKNELPDADAPARPDIVVTPAMPLSLLGTVEAIVDALVLVKASGSGAHQVLNEGSLLVLEDRAVFGVVADTLGRVEAPLYTVRFAAPADIPPAAAVGAQVFYVPQHSDYVFTQALHGLKGSDASNIFDEEVADAEREFSDDEAEAEHKRQRKYVRQARDRGGRGAASASSASSRPDTEELYTPLARPSNLAELMSGPPPLANSGGGGGGNRERAGHGRGRGRGRPRGQRPARARDDFRRRDREAPYQHQYQPYPPQQQQQQQYPQPQYPQQQQWSPSVPPQFPPYHHQQQQNFYHAPAPQFLPQGAHVNPAFLPPPGRNDFNWAPPVPQGGTGGGGGGGGAGDTEAALKALQNLVSLRNQMQPQPPQG